MQKPKIDQYFSNKNIKVYYNTLGHTEELVNSYIATFQDVVTESNCDRSQDVKHKLYGLMYDMEPRTKYTGFEKLSTQDKDFRQRVVSQLSDIFYGPTKIVDKKYHTEKDYKKLLVESLKDIDNIILYFSGGLDSELLANALLDSKKDFRAITFAWKDNQGSTINCEEMSYAIDYSQKHNLPLEIIDLNVEELWQTEEFYNFAVDIQIQSTHQLTHAYAINIVESKYPNSTHLFGGEVRFHITTNQNNEVVNLVFLDKVDPPTWDGLDIIGTSSTAAAGARLIYRADTGAWSATGTPVGSNLSGTWTTTTGSSYEYSVISMSIIEDTGTTIFTPAPINVPTAYAPIGSPTTLCNVRAESTSIAAATYTISVRVVGETSPVVTGTIELRAEGPA